MILKFKKLYSIFFFVSCICTPLFSIDEITIEDTGMLYGKNYYLPHLLVYSFPGFSPNKGTKGYNNLSLSYSGINEFVPYPNSDIALDYESSVLESSYTYRLLDQLLIGIDIRLISYYTGFMDPIIDFWHNTFNFEDAGRSDFPNSNISIMVDNSQGKDAVLNTETLYLGDTDIYGILNLKDESSYSLALATAIKLPTGSFEFLTGSGYFDFGLQVLGEWKINSYWIIGLQQGIILPGDVIYRLSIEDRYASRIMSGTFLSAQFYPQKDISLIGQFRINTSPIRSERVKNHDVFYDFYFYSVPQTSLILGVKKTFGSWLFQLSIEEDTFTYEGADIELSLRVTKAF